MSKFLLFLILLIFPFFVWADNSGNSNGYAWFEKIGWVHFSGEDAGVDYGIKISSDQITGYAWSEKTGWISLNCLNSFSCNGQPYGVVSDGEGNLSGYAWSEKAGWINFNGVGTVEYQVQIDSNGNLSGYAWSEKAGWINTDDIGENYGVTTTAGEGYCEDCVPCNPPVLAWNLDEGIGTIAYDSSFRGNNIYNNGTVAGGAVWQSQSECVSGKCLYFDGSNDNVNRAFDTDLSFKDNSFSIGGWFKTSTVANPAYLFSRYDTAGWKVWLDADGDACFGIDDDNVWSGETPDDFICTVGKNYDDNTWHYILAEKDVAGGIYLYLDGREEISDLTLAATGPLSGTSPIFYAGVNSDGTSSPFSGFLDSIKIYDYARSTEQIKQDYNAGLSGVSSNRGVSVSAGDSSPKWMSDGLVGYWKMDETTGTTVADSSGNNNNGTLTNAQETGTSDASGNTTTTMIDTDGTLATTDDAYNGMILRFTAVCGSIASGTERTITDYTGASKTFIVTTALASVPNSCAYEIDHQVGGKFGSGVGFDGGNDYASIPENSNLSAGNNGSGHTLSFWVKVPLVLSTSTYTHVSKYASSNYEYKATGTYYTSGIAQYGFEFYQLNGSGAGGSIGWQSPAGFYPNQWVNVICTIDKNAQSGAETKIFINGELKESGYLNANIGDGSANLVIGQLGLSGGNFLNGSMDETRIYNRALSPDEIKQLYKYAPGPVLHLKLDEKSGTTAFDSSGNNNHGTFINNPSWLSGKINGALDFDGADDGVLLSGFGNIAPKYSGTVSMWVNKKQDVTDNKYLYAQGGSGHSPSLYINTDDKVSFQLSSGGTVTLLPLIKNRWYHIEATWNDLETVIYIDGIRTASGVGGTTVPYGNAYIGRFTSSGWEAPVLIDDVRVYNYARTQEQILEDMGASAGASTSRGALKKPILDLSFDEGQGLTAFDGSGNGNNGTLNAGGSGTNATTTAMWDKGGKKNGAMEFDNLNDYINVGSNINIANKSFTISSWAKRNSNVDADYIAGQGVAGGSVGLHYGFRAGNTFTCAFGGNDLDAAISNDTNWHNWICSYDADTNLRIIYRDGKEIARGTATVDYQGSGVFNVGARYSVAESFFGGLVDDFKLYNYALSEDEIKTLYNDSSAMVMGNDESRDNNGTEVTGANKEYCIPGDTAKCDKPVLELKMDEMTGTTAYDTSGNGNNGTLTGGPVWDRGKIGNALSFPLNSDYISLGSSNSFALDEYTISTYVNIPANIPTGQVDILNRRSSGDWSQSNFILNLVNDSGTYPGRIDFAHVTSGDVVESVVGNADIRNSGWRFLTVSYDGINQSIYLDGKLEKAELAASPETGGTQYLYLNRDATVANSGIPGLKIDEVRIYNYARTPAQIAWDYNRGKPIGHWKMDEASGTQVDDWSGNANHGTINGAIRKDESECKIGKCLYFDGEDDYVQTANSMLFPNSGSAISFWYKSEGAVDANSTFFIDQSNRDRLSFSRNGNDLSLIFRIQNENVLFTPTTNIFDGEWHYMMVAWNVDGGWENLYIDGKLESDSTTYIYPVASTILRIGGNGGAYRVRGKMDDVKIYYYAPTEDQIKMYYNGGAVNFQ